MSSLEAWGRDGGDISSHYAGRASEDKVCISIAEECRNKGAGRKLLSGTPNSPGDPRGRSESLNVLLDAFLPLSCRTPRFPC